MRANSPSGTITTVGHASLIGASVSHDGQVARLPLNPGGVAVSRDGALGVSTASDMVQAAAHGLNSTVVHGGPSAGVDAHVHGMPVAVLPEALAVDGQGDLVVFSSSPKLLFLVDPVNGQLTALTQDYATTLSVAPGGPCWWPSTAGSPSA